MLPYSGSVPLDWEIGISMEHLWALHAQLAQAEEGGPRWWEALVRPVSMIGCKSRAFSLEVQSAVLNQPGKDESSINKLPMWL